MNEYQKFVANKAQVLISLMEDIAAKDVGVAKLLGAMREELTLFIDGKEPLPSTLLEGWWHYFSPDGPHGIYEAYPALVDAYCALSWVLRYDQMERYLKAQNNQSSP